jgi:hypothetical protein
VGFSQSLVGDIIVCRLGANFDVISAFDINNEATAHIGSGLGDVSQEG